MDKYGFIWINVDYQGMGFEPHMTCASRGPFQPPPRRQVAPGIAGGLGGASGIGGFDSHGGTIAG